LAPARVLSFRSIEQFLQTIDRQPSRSRVIGKLQLVASTSFSRYRSGNRRRSGDSVRIQEPLIS